MTVPDPGGQQAPDPAADKRKSKGKRQGRRASYREGASYSALTFGSVAVLALTTAIVNSRMYGIDVIGQYALAIATMAAVRLTSTTKERPALVRELTLLEPRHPRVTGLFLATLSFSFVLTLIVSLLALLVTHLLLSGPISQPGVFVPTAAALAGYVFIGNTVENVDVVFNGFRAGRELFWGRLNMAIAFLVISFAVGIFYDTVWGLVAGQVGSMVVGLIQRVWLIRPYMRFSASRDVIRDGYRTLPGLIRFGLKITPGAIADGGSQECGTWIVASFGTIADVGAYGRAYLMIKQLLTLNVRMNAMLFPTLLERRAKKDGPGYARALVDSQRYTTMALMLPAAACGGVAPGIMHLFGSGFGRGAMSLAILVLVPPLTALSQNQRVALLSLDRAGLGSVSGLLRFTATVGLGILLTSQLGAPGAALALVIGLLVDLGFATQIVMRNVMSPLRPLWPVREWLALAFAYAAGFAAGRVVYVVLGFAFGLPLGGIVGGIVFLVALWAGRGFNDRDLERIRDVRQQIARRRGRTPAVAVMVADESAPASTPVAAVGSNGHFEPRADGVGQPSEPMAEPAGQRSERMADPVGHVRRAALSRPMAVLGAIFGVLGVLAFIRPRQS